MLLHNHGSVLTLRSALTRVKTPTKLGLAAATFGGLGITGLEALKSMATTRIRTLAAESQECHFLQLPSELRNEIYSIVSTDLIRTVCLGKRAATGSAFASKQISQEYLSIRAGKVVTTKYLKTLDPPEWRDIDANGCCSTATLVASGQFSVRPLPLMPFVSVIASEEKMPLSANVVVVANTLVGGTRPTPLQSSTMD